MRALPEERTVGLDNASARQPLLPPTLAALRYRLDVSLLVRVVLPLPFLLARASKETTQLVSGMLDLTEFAKVMSALPAAGQEFAQMHQLQVTLTPFAPPIGLVALLTVKAVSPREVLVPATQAPSHHASASLGLMDSAKVQAPLLHPLVLLKFALKLPPPPTLTQLAQSIKLAVKLLEMDALPPSGYVPVTLEQQQPVKGMLELMESAKELILPPLVHVCRRSALKLQPVPQPMKLVLNTKPAVLLMEKDVSPSLGASTLLDKSAVLVQ